MTSKKLNLPKSLQRFASKITDVSDERGSGDGYWVYLKKGWINTLSETHCIHEDTITDCAKEMRFVEVCHGECCK